MIKYLINNSKTTINLMSQLQTQQTYLLLNTCYGGPSYKMDFVKEIFYKFPPNTDIGKKLFPPTKPHNDNNLIIHKLFFKNDGYTYFNMGLAKVEYEQESKLSDSTMSSDTTDSDNDNENSNSNYIFETTTNTHYYLSPYNSSWYKNQQLIQYIMHRKDNQIISESTGKFTSDFYKLLDYSLCNYIEFNNTIDTNADTNNLDNHIIQLDYTKELKYRQTELFKLTIFPNNYLEKTIYNENQELIKTVFGKFTFDESNWRHHEIAHKIYSKIYLTDVCGSLCKFQICRFDSELTFNINEYDGSESVSVELPNDKIITELVQLYKGLLDIKDLSKFTQLLLDENPMTIQEIRKKHEQVY